jgi:predicted nucleotidyltransferase
MVEDTITDMNEAPEIARKYADLLRLRIHISGIFLFGSSVKGTAHLDSDIDIAVVSSSFTGDPVDDLTTLLLLKSEVDNRIEPHPFLPDEFTDDNPFVREIMETSVRIV